MQSAIPFILCVSVMVLSVQARSIEPSVENEMSKEQNGKQYLKFLTYLKHQAANSNNDDSDDSSSSSTEEQEKQLLKRNFFLFPDRRSNQKYQPVRYSYGRKSHWDTFFG